MDFKAATDVLFGKIDHDAMAKALKISVASVRQARLKEGANAKRSPPDGWQRAASRLARERVAELENLLRSLDGHDLARRQKLQNKFEGAKLINQ